MIYALIAFMLFTALLARAASQPDVFHVSRDILINAPADKVFALLSDFRNQLKWSPFEKDPQMKRSFSGPATGVGAVYAWEGNAQVGAGNITVTKVVENEKMVMRLIMLRPMKTDNTVTFDLQPRGDNSTQLVWSMSSRQSFLGKLVGTVINCKRFMERDFDSGLMRLKALAES